MPSTETTFNSFYYANSGIWYRTVTDKKRIKIIYIERVIYNIS
jgi:hypothetical protein